MIIIITIFIGSFIIGKMIKDNEIKAMKEKRQLEREKEMVIKFIGEKLYHNQLTSLHYLEFWNGEHILQIQYNSQFYKIRIKKLIGVDEFTYRLEDLPIEQIDDSKNYNKTNK